MNRLWLLFIFILTLSSCLQSNLAPPTIDSSYSWFYSNHYDEAGKLYRLNPLQQARLNFVTLEIESKTSETQTVDCEDRRMIGKTPRDFGGKQTVTTTTIKGKFANWLMIEDKKVYLDVVKDTKTFTESTDCLELD